MKKTIAIMTVVVLAGSLSASAALIAGWEVWGGGTGEGASRTDGATGLASYNTAGEWLRGDDYRSNDGTFGALVTAPVASDLTANLDGIALNNINGGSMDFLVTLTGSNTDLQTFHFDAARRGFAAPENWVLSIVSGTGGVTTGDVASGTLAVNNTTDLDDIDVDLTVLADHDIGVAGNVLFRLTFTDGNATVGQMTKLDNVGVSAIPEPATLGLLGAAAGGLLFMRRRFTV